MLPGLVSDLWTHSPSTLYIPHELWTWDPTVLSLRVPGIVLSGWAESMRYLGVTVVVVILGPLHARQTLLLHYQPSLCNFLAPTSQVAEIYRPTQPARPLLSVNVCLTSLISLSMDIT